MPTYNSSMDMKKQVRFQDIGVNTTFVVFHSPNGLDKPMWCSKIDDSRFILIGESGCHHPADTDLFFVEDKTQ